jgi:hypothetical protein
MTTAIIFIVGMLAVCALYLLTLAIRAYLQWRGTRLVTCPETHETAAVVVDARHAALTATVEVTDIRLKQCTRWPERQDCGQECLRQIEQAPEDCLVRMILTKWYADRSCALCGEPFGTIHSWDRKPGLLSADGAAMECTAVPAEKLPAVLATHKPVCWNCEVSEEFRRSHPELIIDRPGQPVVHHRKAG